jgi:hypothetical protein
VRVVTVVVIAAVVLGACAAPLPVYPEMEPEAALATMRVRDGAVRSMTTTATVTIRDAQASSVSLDAVIVAKWPDHLRLRAWKFGSAAFDLTFTPEGLWVYVPDEAQRRAGGSPGFEVTADQFRRVWALIGPRAMEGAVARETDDSLVAVHPLDPGSSDGGSVEFDIDKRTLTVHECRFVDPTGSTRHTLRLDSYRVFSDDTAGKIVWPTRITATGEHGHMSIRLGTPEFNAEPAPEAFAPPRRATKQPSRATDSPLGR